MKIKQIWQSFNFRNNKILNAKVEEPQEDEHIASKKYVDITSTYDTDKAEQFPTGSPKFSWLNFSLHGKSFKDILDALFFPIVLPVYKEVELNSMSIKAINEFGDNLFAGKATSFSIIYDIDRGDRQGNTTPKIRVTTKAPVTVTEYSGNSSANSGEFGFNVNLQNIDKIELIKMFEEVSTIKEDNYGTPYIPVAFTQNYEAKFDVLEILLEKYTIHQPILYKKLVPDEDYEAIVASVNNGDSISVPIATVLQSFTRDTKLFTTNDANNTFLFAIPRYFSILFVKCYCWCWFRIYKIKT